MSTTAPIVLWLDYSGRNGNTLAHDSTFVRLAQRAIADQRDVTIAAFTHVLHPKKHISHETLVCAQETIGLSELFDRVMDGPTYGGTDFAPVWSAAREAAEALHIMSTDFMWRPMPGDLSRLVEMHPSNLGYVSCYSADSDARGSIVFARRRYIEAMRENGVEIVVDDSANNLYTRLSTR